MYTVYQPIMTIDLVQQVKSRARSVQLDKNAISASVTEIGSNTTEASITEKPRPNSVSGTGQENARKSSAPASVPLIVRPVRSMLQVEQPPNLRPLEPMSFVELYSPPVEETGAFLQWGRSHDNGGNYNLPPTISHYAYPAENAMPCLALLRSL